MKRFLFSFFVLVVCVTFSLNVLAAEEPACTENCCPINPPENEQPKEIINPEIADITDFINNYAKQQNKHNIVALKKMYSDDFVNSDGFNKEQLFKLIKRTHTDFPDIKFDIKIQNILVNSDYAMVTVKESISANTKAVSKITGDKGSYHGDITSVIYLKEIATGWRIYAEDVLDEASIMAYGTAKDIPASLNVPQKVLVDTDYCVGVNLQIPAGYSAMASINKTEIVDDYNVTGEVFRAINPDKSSLERVLRANKDNNNEAVLVSIGFTQTGEDIFKKPKVDISGLIMLMKRVDVVPHTSNLTKQQEKKNAKK